MILDVLCKQCGGVLKAVAPKFEMPRHGLPTVKCKGIGMPGIPLSLVHVPIAPARVQARA